MHAYANKVNIFEADKGSEAAQLRWSDTRREDDGSGRCARRVGFRSWRVEIVAKWVSVRL